MTVDVQMYRALSVVALDRETRAFLQRTDPKAFEQVEAALRAADKARVNGPADTYDERARLAYGPL